MDVTGAFTCGEFSVSSDIRIKENIQKIDRTDGQAENLKFVIKF